MKSPSSEPISSGTNESGVSPNLEVDFNSDVSGNLFRTEGQIVLWSNESLPYLLLNATLWNSSSPVIRARYLMIDVEPGMSYGFEISKNSKIPSGSYNCTLEISGPEGPIRSETRRCLAEEKPKASGLSGGPNSPEGEEVRFIFVPEKELEKYSALSGGQGQKEPRKPGSQDKSPDATTALSNQSTSGSKHATSSGEMDSEKGASETAGGPIGVLVGSTSSNKYHRANCRFAAKIKPENKVYFESAEEAEKQGYQPCKTCNPT